MENNHRGRPPKKSYDPESLMQELINTVVEVYDSTQEIKATALELSLPPNKVKKLLITAKVITYPETEQIQSLQAEHIPMAEIQRIMNLSYSSINTYLPYSKCVYKAAEISQNAERIKRYKARKDAVEELAEDCTAENLWRCIIAFQEYPFHTSSGLPFSYSLKIGRNGEYTKELFIDRRENSKSLSWSSIRLAFQNAEPGKVYLRPKALGDIRGISYGYSLLWRFGLIRVPETVENKLRGKRR